MGTFKIVDSVGEWLLVEHYVGDNRNPLEVRWVLASLVRSLSMAEAFYQADPHFDPTEVDKTDPMHKRR